jgi:exonuclease SbcC
MIKSLEIQNLQSHKNSKLEFVPGVNVIIGKSDTGKSAIIRALYWLIWNKPLGDSIRSNWGGDVKVQAILDDCEITRVRSESKKAFEQAVTEELIQQLNIDSINFKSQKDDFFLIKDSPGQVAEHFNKIAHIDQIGIGESNINKWIKNLQNDLKNENGNLELYQENLEQYGHLDKFEIDVELLEQLEIQLINKSNLHSKLEELIENIKNTEKEIEKESSILEMEKDINIILDLIDKRDKKDIEIESLEDLIDNITNSVEQQTKLETKTNKLQKEFNELMGDVCILCGQKINKNEKNKIS